MKVKNKPKKDIGVSIKIETAICEKLRSYCQERGLKIGHVATKAIEEKLNSLLVETN